jgi:hypothetical protein
MSNELEIELQKRNFVNELASKIENCNLNDLQRKLLLLSLCRSFEDHTLTQKTWTTLSEMFGDEINISKNE